MVAHVTFTSTKQPISITTIGAVLYVTGCTNHAQDIICSLMYNIYSYRTVPLLFKEFKARNVLIARLPQGSSYFFYYNFLMSQVFSCSIFLILTITSSIRSTFYTVKFSFNWKHIFIYLLYKKLLQILEV